MQNLLTKVVAGALVGTIGALPLAQGEGCSVEQACQARTEHSPHSEEREPAPVRTLVLVSATASSTASVRPDLIAISRPGSR